MTEHINLSYDEIVEDLYGIILLDGNEVVIRVYNCVQEKWKLIRYQSYDLTPFDKRKIVNANDIVEVIAGASIANTALKVAEWKMYARNLTDITVHDITTATGIPAELLTLNREQELLCKGVLMEF